MEQDIFDRLFTVIDDRKNSEPSVSYVSSLLTKGLPKIMGKIMEEAGEVCSAAQEGDREHLVHEICDLFFHTFVLAGYKNISLDEIKAELERRFGTSGHDEKARRTG